MTRSRACFNVVSISCALLLAAACAPKGITDPSVAYDDEDPSEDEPPVAETAKTTNPVVAATTPAAAAAPAAVVLPAVPAGNQAASAPVVVAPVVAPINLVPWGQAHDSLANAVIVLGTADDVDGHRQKAKDAMELADKEIQAAIEAAKKK